QPKTVVFAANDREYVDFKIEELRKYFLMLPLTSVTAPNVNRYYITNQNDKIVDTLSRSISASNSRTTSSSGGSGSFDSLTVGNLTVTATSSLNSLVVSGSATTTFSGNGI